MAKVTLHNLHTHDKNCAKIIQRQKEAGNEMPQELGVINIQCMLELLTQQLGCNSEGDWRVSKYI